MKTKATRLHISTFLLLILVVSINWCDSSTIGPPTLAGLTIFDLFPNTLADLAGLSNQWTVTGLINSNQRDIVCEDPILGGPGILQPNAVLERTYTNLPSHNFVAYVVRAFAFGNWQTGDSIKLFIDGAEIMQWKPKSILALGSLPVCSGHSYFDIFMVGRLAHTGSSMKVTLVSNVPSNTAGISFGIRGIRYAFSTVGVAINACFNPRGLVGWGCGCPYDTYSPSLNACSGCSPNCGQCYGPSDADCFTCGWGHYYDGQRCLPCTANCALCSGPNSNQCYYCNSGYRTNWDGTCGPISASCPSPYVVETFGTYVQCNTKCHSSGEYTYKDDSCSPICDPPYTPRTVGTAKFCDGPCSVPTYFYYPSTTQCKPTCPSPYRVDGVSLCKTSCELAGEFTYQDLSCSTTCNLPFTPRIVGTTKLCDGPCLDPTYFYYPSTQQCKPTCPYPYQVDGVHFCIIKVSQEDQEQLETITNVMTAGAYGVPAAAVILSIFNSGNPGAFSISILADMLQYIRYMKISYPPKLQFLLDQDSPSVSIIPEIPDSVVSKLKKHEMPEKFDQYQTHSSFLVNFWQEMITLAVIIVGGGISAFTANKAKNCRFVGFFWLKMKQWLKWNFFLMTLTSNFGDIVIGSSLEFRTYTNDSGLSGLSFGICIFINIFAVIVFAKMVYVIMAIQKTSASRSERYENPSIKVSKQWEDYSMLFESYKENSRFAQGFFIFFIVRVMVFNAIIAYLINYPLVQSILITGLSLITLIYIGITRPFKQITDFITTIIEELLVLTVNACTMSLAIIDSVDPSNFDDRLPPANIIIYCNIAFNAIGFLSMVVQIGVLLWNIYKIIKSRTIKGKMLEKVIDRPLPKALDETALEPIAGASSLSSTLPKHKSRQKPSNQGMVSNSRLEPVGPVLLPDGKVKKMKKPIALTKAKLMPSEVSKRGNILRGNNSGPKTTINLTRIYRPEIQYIENERPPRSIYEMLRNEARAQARGPGYNQ